MLFFAVLSKLLIIMKLKLAMEEFDSFDAYLYKHGIIRKLLYTETHIVGLTQHILSHGSS